MHKVIILIFLLFFSTVSAEERCSKVSCYPEKITKLGKDFYLLGKSDFTYLFMDIYSVALYTDQASFSGDILDPLVPKILHFKYHRKIERDRIVNGAVDTLKKNSEFVYESYKLNVYEINQHYQDVDKGSEYWLSYFPDIGISLSDSKQVYSTVKEPQFAKYYLGIWLSKYPLSNRVRDQLLSKAE